MFPYQESGYHCRHQPDELAGWFWSSDQDTRHIRAKQPTAKPLIITPWRFRTITEKKFWLKPDGSGHQALDVHDHVQAVEESPELFGLDSNDLRTVHALFPHLNERHRVIIESAMESGWVAVSRICRCRVNYFSFAFTNEAVSEARLLQAANWFGQRHGLRHTDVVIAKDTAAPHPQYSRYLYGDLLATASNTSGLTSCDPGDGI